MPKKFIGIFKKQISQTNPEDSRLEYEERKDRLRRVLMNRRAKATNDTIESAPQDDLNDMSNHENEPKP